MVMDVTPSPQCVGREFVRQYYTLLNEAPQFLHRFYSNNSSFIHGGDAKPGEEEQKPIIGQTDIHKKIMSLNFKDCHAKIRYVDSQSTIGTGVVVQVTGELSNNQAPLRRFMQTFVLAPQTPNKYYVNNDIFRYQDEVFTESDEEDETAEEASKISEKCPPQEPNQLEGVHPGNDLSIYQQQQQHMVAEQDLHAHHQQVNGGVMGIAQEQAEHVMTNGHEEPVVSPPPTAPIEEPVKPVIPEPAVMTAEAPAEAATEQLNIPDDHAEANIQENFGEDPTAAGDPPKPRSWANIAHVSGVPASAPATNTQPQNYNAPPPNHEEKKPLHNTQRGNPMRNNRPNVTLSSEQKGFGESAAPGMGFGDPAVTVKVARPEEGFGGEEKRPERIKYPDSQQVFVGNLPSHISDFELRDFFKAHGNVLEVRINRSSAPKIPFGFVVFDSEAVAQKVLALKNMEYNGHRLNIEEKKTRGHNPRQHHGRPRHARGSLGGRGGGYGGHPREDSGSRTDQGRFNNLNKSNTHRR